MPVYCKCEMPYSPDKLMVQCSACLNCECVGAQQTEDGCCACTWKGGKQGESDGPVVVHAAESVAGGTRLPQQPKTCTAA